MFAAASPLANSSFWGSLFFAAFNATTMNECVRMMNYSAIGLGSGDFLSDAEYLNSFLEALPPALPVVSSNVRFGRHPLLAVPRGNGAGRPKVEPYTVLDVGGRKVAIVR